MIDPQGQKAAGNGSKFEDIIEDAVCGILSIPSLRWDAQTFVLSKDRDILWKNVPYVSIYGTNCRSEFVLQFKGRKIRIECKYQESAGSVDEKLPYLMMNFTREVPEEETIIIIEGEGFREGAVNWLRESCQQTKCKVFNATQFLFYLTSINANCKQEQT
jgi:hypothetical protein|tara:strand:+ start:509 stop:988 length:480 start_codon:yes stop_codon:yes gene_type:complete